jgi:hypothetical protein
MPFDQFDQQAIQDLLRRDMSRREFLKYMIGVLVSVVGITSLLNSVLHGSKKNPRTATVNDAYGGGNYSAKAKPGTPTLRGNA